MTKIQHVCKVVANDKICPKFYRLCFAAELIRKKVWPGQFVHIRVRDGLEPFFRRPFSVSRLPTEQAGLPAGRASDKEHVEILYEVVGPGTRILASKKKGDTLDVLGPLGTPFRMPPQGIRQVVMIAGGIGAAPFFMLSDALKGKGYDLILLYGARTGEHVFNMREFKRNGCKVYVATDDGSVEVRGRVSVLFDKIKPDPATTFLYACGPRPMIASVQAFARQYNIGGQVSCEETMACGLGACLGCTIHTVSGYKTVCCDGPVFEMNEVILE